MWYKISREIAKYNQFQNFDEVASAIVQYIKTIQNIDDEQSIDKFNNQNIKLVSNENTIPVIAVEGPNNPNYISPLAYSADGSILINTLQARKTNINKIIPMLAHELQHAVEHAYKPEHWLEDRETNKHKKWIDQANHQIVSDGEDPESYENLTKYYNMPTEVRARLAEVLHNLNLPANKENLQTQSATKESLMQIIKDNVNQQRSMLFMSPKAIDYLVKELYKAIYN